MRTGFDLQETMFGTDSHPETTVAPGRIGPWFIALSVVLGCANTPEGSSDWRSCTDRDCRARWAVDRWDSEQGAVIDAVTGLDDELERTAIVTDLGRAHPGRIGRLCETLAAGPTRDTCSSLNSRVHLVENQPAATTSRHRRAAGPSSWRLDVSDLPASRLAGAALGQGVCVEATDTSRCLLNAAQQAAMTGKLPQAAAICESIADPKWQAECAFAAAERHVAAAPWTPATMGGAVDLCLLAGRYADNCLAHIPVNLARLAGGMDPADGAGWDGLTATGDALRSALVDRGAPGLADAVDQLFWAETTGAVFTPSCSVSGDALDHVPERARPHVHAAAAASLVRRTKPADEVHLSALADTLRGELERRSEQADGDGATPACGLVGIWRPRDDLWPMDRPEDVDVAAVIYLGASRRTWVAEDDGADLRIAILEAWVREHPESTSLLDDADSDPNPQVVWTAKRLRRGGPHGVRH